MPLPRLATACLLGLITATAVAAPPAPDPALLQASIVLAGFDRLDAGCAGRYSAAQQAQLQRWRDEQAVDAVRERIYAWRTGAGTAAAMESAATRIVQLARSQGASDCSAALALAQLPEAQFSRIAPLAPPPREAAAPATPTTRAELSVGPGADVADIDSFGFATRPKMGLGGFIALDVYPVVLFKNGELLTEVRGLRHAGGLAAHRAAKPDAWSRWRRHGGQLQALKGGQWTALPFSKTYARLPANLALNGHYRSTAGTGNLAAGGSQSVTVVDEYRFSPGGRVLRHGTVGSTGQAGSTAVTTQGGPSERAGRYHMDGLLLHIDYEDGSREQRVLITDPDQPGSTLWLDGAAYIPRR
ncbi:hypothetical protein [Roseateles sp. LKC17W]|uniref:Uncharacterized protein n=1 Tax=Pelomonas margarita TaxID=3299031 RepID=A0ABW7FL73_9BURK